MLDSTIIFPVGKIMAVKGVRFELLTSTPSSLTDYRPLTSIKPKAFGAIGQVDGILTDDTLAIQAFFDSVYLFPDSTVMDFSGHWGITSSITIDKNGSNRYNFVAGMFEYIGTVDIDYMVLLEDIRDCTFTGKLSVVGSGSTTYTTRKVTDLIITNSVGGATFTGGIWGRYAKRHGISLGGTIAFSSHIGIDLGRCYFANCGAVAFTTTGTNVRGKNYDFTGRVDSGSGTSVTQKTTVTITGGVDVLQEGAVFRHNGRYHIIQEVDEGLGNIVFYPWLSTNEISGTIESSHGAAVRNRGGNSASVRIGGLKALGCGVGLDNQCLYGPHVSNLETQVVGVSYKQDGLCRGTLIDVFHPETPEGDVDVLKCDTIETDTVISGLSVYRDEDIKILTPVNSSGVELQSLVRGITMDYLGIPTFAGKKKIPNKPLTSATLSNSADTDLVVLENDGLITVSLNRDVGIAEKFGYTTIEILRVGDRNGLIAGATNIKPTSAEVGLGVTVMGASVYSIPALNEGSKILCRLDISRDDWRVYVFESKTTPL
tara:strand:- start:72 stop:1697 length:1626 start_codon:yes stop_codon:yes gene_type:complete